MGFYGESAELNMRHSSAEDVVDRKASANVGRVRDQNTSLVRHDRQCSIRIVLP